MENPQSHTYFQKRKLFFGNKLQAYYATMFLIHHCRIHHWFHTITVIATPIWVFIKSILLAWWTCSLFTPAFLNHLIDSMLLMPFIWTSSKPLTLSLIPNYCTNCGHLALPNRYGYGLKITYRQYTLLCWNKWCKFDMPSCSLRCPPRKCIVTSALYYLYQWPYKHALYLTHQLAYFANDTKLMLDVGESNSTDLYVDHNTISQWYSEWEPCLDSDKCSLIWYLSKQDSWIPKYIFNQLPNYSQFKTFGSRQNCKIISTFHSHYKLTRPYIHDL